MNNRRLLARVRALALLIALALVAQPLQAQELVQWTEGPGRLGLGYPVPTPVDTALPFDGFRSYAGLHARHQDLMMTNPVVHGQVVGQTLLGRDIWAYRLGSDSNLDPLGQPKSAVMYAGTVHAREWQSPEVVTGLMELMADNADDDHWLGYIRDHVNIVVVPVINIDGFLQTQRYPASNWMGTDNRHPQFWPRDGRMRRKNHRGADETLSTVGDHLSGIDINRNNPPFFPGPQFTDIPADLTYRGPAEQSEPETQALVAAADLAPGDRLRFYADMHSYTRVFFSVHTGNWRRNAIQNRLFNMITEHHRRLPGGKVYTDERSFPNTGIGTTSEYFGHAYQVPSMTWEIEPGSQGGAEYGGFRSNGHDGFILPNSEIRRVRENLALSMAAAAYHMAGPPHILQAKIFDADSDSLIWSARWQEADELERQLLTFKAQALQPGRDYRIWIAFSKPMRWREDGEIKPFPGRPASGLAVNLAMLANGDALDIDWSEPEWQKDAGLAPHGRLRYRDDAFSATFNIADTLDNHALIAAGSDDEPIRLALDLSDLTGHRLDADPATAVDFVDGTWEGYETDLPGQVDAGGPDKTLQPAVTSGPVEAAPLSRPGHSAMWLDRERSGEGWMLELLDDNRAIAYFFTYDEHGQQRWLFGDGIVTGNRIHFDTLLLPTGGRFGPDFDVEAVERIKSGWATLTFSDCDNGWYDIEAFGQHNSFHMERLIRPLGLDCPGPASEVPDHARQSGSWYDPDSAGQGFTLQWFNPDQALILWFTYSPDGEQYWMIGTGEREGDRIYVPELLAARGARFGSAFDPDDVELFEWGSLELQLNCLTGHAEYHSILPEFGAGTLNLVRLSKLAELEC